MLTLLILQAALAADVDGANLITNGGFEQADSENADWPAGFTSGKIGKAPAEMTWESPGYKSDRCVVVTTGDSSGLGYWQTLAKVKPETTYTISFQYKIGSAEPGKATSGEAIYNQQRPGGPNLELSAPAEGSKPTRWTDCGAAMDPVGGLFLPVATKWSPFQYTFKTRPEQTQLVIKLRLWCYAQKVWFDDLALSEGLLLTPLIPIDPLWEQRDTTPPAIHTPKPPPNTAVEPDASISAAISDDVDPATVRVELDGKDVTAQATVADGRVSVKTKLAAGAHRASITADDRAGNRGNTLSWQFGVGETLRNKMTAAVNRTQLNGEPFFPLCIYAYSVHPDDGRFRPDHLQQAAAAGYNIVLNTIEKRKGLDKELAAGIMGTLNISYSLKFCTDPEAAETALFEAVEGKIASHQQGQYADHPAVVAFWGDDPENVENTDATPMPESAKTKLTHARDALKKRYPDIPSVFAISNLPRVKDGMKYGDILLSYRYAAPHYHPMMVNGYTIAVCRRMVPDKPMWFLSQAFDLGYGAQFDLPEPMRPTPAEMRAMAFYSLVCGIKGYAIYANYLNAEDYPEHWRLTLDIGTQMRQIAPALAEGRDVRSARIEKAPHAGSIFFREIVHDGVHTLIAANMSGGTVPATWRFRQPVQAVALFEDRAMARKAKKVGDVFEPWGVHLYQWGF